MDESIMYPIPLLLILDVSTSVPKYELLLMLILTGIGTNGVSPYQIVSQSDSFSKHQPVSDILSIELASIRISITRGGT